MRLSLSVIKHSNSCFQFFLSHYLNKLSAIAQEQWRSTNNWIFPNSCRIMRTIDNWNHGVSPIFNYKIIELSINLSSVPSIFFDLLSVPSNQILSEALNPSLSTSVFWSNIPITVCAWDRHLDVVFRIMQWNNWIWSHAYICKIDSNLNPNLSQMVQREDWNKRNIQP